jgi:SAM-dependent methyltransferase
MQKEIIFRNIISMENDSSVLFGKYLEEARSAPFRGWNFEYLTKTNRMVLAPIKWNYFNKVVAKLTGVTTLLDMGTGGGEVLSRFAPLPTLTYATEQYEPNIPVARWTLEPLGVKVIKIDTRYKNNEVLPFENEKFDLIINRQESYHPPELLRILKPAKYFVTQQVGQGFQNLRKLLTGKEKPDSGWNLKYLITGLESTGFEIIEALEDVQEIRLFDVGAVTYWLKAIPWIIDDFDIDRNVNQLLELHNQIYQDGYYDTSYDLFLLVARKKHGTTNWLG